MAKMRKLEWSKVASLSLNDIFDYLEVNWTEREVRLFSERLENQLEILSTTPEIYKKSMRKKNLHECQIAPYHTLFYTYNDDTLFIVELFDNRQNPKKLDRL
jgi:plasmid stabilization system protein ParE